MLIAMLFGPFSMVLSVFIIIIFIIIIFIDTKMDTKKRGHAYFIQPTIKVSVLVPGTVRYVPGTVPVPYVPETGSGSGGNPFQFFADVAGRDFLVENTFRCDGLQ